MSMRPIYLFFLRNLKFQFVWKSIHHFFEKWCLPVSPVRAISSSPKNRAWPKSATLTCMASSRNMLLGFKSRWRSLGFCSCKYCIAWAISKARPSLSCKGGSGTIRSLRRFPGPWSHSFSVVLRYSVTTHAWWGGSIHAPMSWSTNLWRCRDSVSSSWEK